MNNLQVSQQQLETSHQINSLKQSLALAIERTNTVPFNIENMVKDILTEFPKLNDDSMSMAIRNGSLGKYGRTYKLSTQEVCIWIREHLKSSSQYYDNGTMKGVL